MKFTSPGVLFSGGQKTFSKRNFPTTMASLLCDFFAGFFFSNINPKCVFKFTQRSVDGKPLIRFQSETSVFNFLQDSDDEATEGCNENIGIEITLG